MVSFMLHIFTTVFNKALKCMILLIWDSRKGKTVVTESLSGGFQRPQLKKGLTIKKDTRELFGVMNALYLYWSSGYATVYICHNYLNYTLKPGEFFLFTDYSFMKLIEKKEDKKMARNLRELKNSLRKMLEGFFHGCCVKLVCQVISNKIEGNWATWICIVTANIL